VPVSSALDFMNTLQFIGIGFLSCLLLYQIWVSIGICRAAEYDTRQRVLQLLVVWLVPLIGTVGCHLFLRSSRQSVPRGDYKFMPQGRNDAGPMD
jgi:membrane protein DedA with SNARE-associated domain